MDNKTAHTLVKLNNAFYTQVHDSFSQTRQAPWNGWKRLVEEIPSSFWNRSSLNVLDLACGNGRFEQFLTSLHSHTVFKALCVDSCDELFAREVLSPSASLATTFYHWDILDELNIVAGVRADYHEKWILPPYSPQGLARTRVGLSHRTNCSEWLYRPFILELFKR